MVSDKLVDLNKVDQSTIHVSGEEKITWTTAGKLTIIRSGRTTPVKMIDRVAN